MKQIVTRALLLLLGWLPLLAAAQPKPDLVIVAPFNLPASVLPGGSYAMSAVIKNQGAGGSQFNCIGFYLSADASWDATDAYLGASCQSLLFTGQSGTCTIMAPIPALTPVGNRYLLLVADPLNAEQESDETNNVLSFAVTVAGGAIPSLPDLELWRPSISFAAVPPGGSTGAFTFIFNRGAGTVANYEIGCYLSADSVFSASTDVFLGLATGSGLMTSGGTIHSFPLLTVPAATVPGNYYLVLMADPRNVITESNENNNSRAFPLRVTGLATAVANPAGATPDLYPNPAPRGSSIRLGLAGNNGSRLEMACYDAMGRLVAHQWGSGGSAAVFDASQLPAGVYQLHISGGGLHTAQRLQIQ
ncbi:hypothetical protein GCM10027594_16510 [Hymenobacter agri]